LWEYKTLRQGTTICPLLPLETFFGVRHTYERELWELSHGTLLPNFCHSREHLFQNLNFIRSFNNFITEMAMDLIVKI
jgi:hypothetical protein